MIGHGGASHKRSGYVVSLARRLARHHGIASVALDGPAHGERAGQAASDIYLRPEGVDQMTCEWKLAIKEVQDLPEIGEGPIGYWGMSKGARFGVPLAAREPKLSVAVVGLSGPRRPGDVIGLEAPLVSCPVLVFMQWDDELVPRPAVLELFGLLGSTDKRLHSYPGKHQEVPSEAMAASEQFLAERLKR